MFGGLVFILMVCAVEKFPEAVAAVQYQPYCHYFWVMSSESSKICATFTLLVWETFCCYINWCTNILSWNVFISKIPYIDKETQRRQITKTKINIFILTECILPSLTQIPNHYLINHLVDTNITLWSIFWPGLWPTVFPGGLGGGGGLDFLFNLLPGWPTWMHSNVRQNSNGGPFTSIPSASHAMSSLEVHRPQY